MDNESKKDIQSVLEEISRFLFFLGLIFTCLSFFLEKLLIGSVIPLGFMQIAKWGFGLLAAWIICLFAYEILPKYNNENGNTKST